MHDPEYRAEHEGIALARAVAIEVTRYRVEHRPSQRALARQLVMQQPAIARVEAGDVNPSIDTLLRLARALGIEFHVDITREGLGRSA
jgi:transcriptional regulator with XRE-family HTH domain